ncbi:natural resistance-associated macrophage protein-domain-containing protein [Panaeolus papilionaceus]|nr:natural resistance-associated macrophage protein-domain-containing protein [Panaeolus papilionaceus]
MSPAPATRFQEPEEISPPKSVGQRVKDAGWTVLHHATKHIGVGVVCSVAYFDPGNWGVDLQAGSEFGYHLLFVVLLAGIFAVFLQILASRLGCVTGLDLASHNRLLLYNRPKHTLWYRYLGLYPLYVLAEIAIVATDLAELLGSAIALCLLFPSLELWHGVLITAFDVILILGMGDPLRGKPVKSFELLIGGMVLAVLICMVIIITKVNVHWGTAFAGFLPSKTIVAKGGVYTSVGILGATVMPHSLFLGSALATQDRVDFRAQYENDGTLNESVEDLKGTRTRSAAFSKYLQECKEIALSAFRKPPVSEYVKTATTYADRSNNSYEFVRAHIYHGTFDIAGSLLGFAVMINSLILMLASAVFFYGAGHKDGADPASLFDAYDLIRDVVGQAAATIFAIALLAAGQSASIVATVAGQAVCEGFLHWRVSPIVRRMITRLLAIIPAMAVAIAVGRPGIDALLVASQVVLSITLPFVTFPLLYCTSKKDIMTVRKRRGASRSNSVDDSFVINETPIKKVAALESADDFETVDYSNNKIAIGFGIIIWLIVVAANLYAIVELALGNAGA